MTGWLAREVMPELFQACTCAEAISCAAKRQTATTDAALPRPPGKDAILRKDTGESWLPAIFGFPAGKEVAARADR
jgi:hypothetical protein